MPKKKNAHRIGSARTTRRYQKVAIGFLLVTVLLILIIVYFSFASTVITVTPVPVTQRASLTVRLQDASAEKPEGIATLSGSLLTTTVTSSLTSNDVTPSGKVDDIATGTVTIYNHWSQTQPLQATTRLMSAHGELFRIKNRVDVPAGGEVDNVEVYADQPGASGNISPTRFTIPGLWQGLQGQIYAESFSTMTGGTRDARIVTAENQEALDTQLMTNMRAEAEEKFADMVTQNDPPQTVAPIAEELQKKTFSANVGDQADQLTLDKTVRFVAAAYRADELETFVEQKLRDNAKDNLEHSVVNPASLALRATQYSITGKSADLVVDAEGTATVKSSSAIFDRIKLTGKTEDEIKTYFKSFEEIGGVEVRFSPFWIRRTPSLADHIEIRLAE